MTSAVLSLLLVNLTIRMTLRQMSKRSFPKTCTRFTRFVAIGMLSIPVGAERTEFGDIFKALIDFVPGKNAARDKPGHSFAISHFFSIRLRAAGGIRRP
jgi:hypothetical protein